MFSVSVFKLTVFGFNAYARDFSKMILKIHFGVIVSCSMCVM